MNKSTHSAASSAQKSMPVTIEQWYQLSNRLYPYIKNCLYIYSTFHTMGGEAELAEDVLQETYLRALTFAEKHNAPAIENFEAFCKSCANHYILDLQRKNKRFSGSLDTEAFSNLTNDTPECSDPASFVLEYLSLYHDMLIISEAVNSLPGKTRLAILTDLANIMDFNEEEPTPLDRAMQEVGVEMREYNYELPHDKKLRSQHASLLSQGYKRLHDALGTETCPPDFAA